MVPWNSASGGFAYNWQSKWVGIIAIKTERTQIHFLSDVLVAVASLDLRVPTAAHLHLAGHKHVSPPLWIFMFFFPQNSFLLFLITRSSSFSVIHVSVNIKNNVEKDTTLLLFFLSKSPGGLAISFQIKPWVAFRLPCLWVRRTLGRAVGRCTVTSLPNFLVG